VVQLLRQGVGEHPPAQQVLLAGRRGGLDHRLSVPDGAAGGGCPDSVDPDWCERPPGSRVAGQVSEFNSVYIAHNTLRFGRGTPEDLLVPMADVSTSRSGSSSLARDALLAFARSQASQADVDHVMRSLASHDSWLVPVAYAERAWGQSDFDQTIQFPDAAPNTVLNVFTDVESARLADGQPIGPYGGPVDGVTLLGALDSTIEALLVNPASPREHQWFVAAGGFEIARGWASAIAVERALAERGNGPVPVAQLRAHRFYLLVEKATQSITKVSLPDIDGVVAVCFTANDRIEEYV